eukprot:gene17719-19490_t
MGSFISQFFVNFFSQVFVKVPEYPQLETSFLAPDEEELIDRIKTQQLCLKEITLKDRKITGLVVANFVSQGTRLNVRYTTDGWLTHQEILGKEVEYKIGSVDEDFLQESMPNVVGFLFEIADWPMGATLEFAVCYRTSDAEFWDNNNNTNYKVTDIASFL